MKTVTRTYRLPELIVRSFERWKGRTGLTAQEAVAAGLWFILELPGTERDWLMSQMHADLEAGTIKDVPAIPPEVETGKSIPVLGTVLAKQAAVEDLMRRTRQRRSRRSG